MCIDIHRPTVYSGGMRQDRADEKHWLAAAAWDSLVGNPTPSEDPSTRFAHLSNRAEVVAEVAIRIGNERALIAAEWNEAGESYAQIGARVGLGAARVQQLVERARKIRNDEPAQVPTDADTATDRESPTVIGYDSATVTGYDSVRVSKYGGLPPRWLRPKEDQ